MTRPTPDAAFRWSREPWGDALRCRALDPVAQHLFTSRQLALPDADAWRQAAASAGVTADRLMRVKQVHGNGVRVLHRGQVPETACEAKPDGDAIVSNQPGLALAVVVADCVPVLLADPEAGVVGAVHAGRKGLALGVLPATLDRMRGLGARRITAWVGPHICGRCYEVPQEMQDEVAALVPEARAKTSWGTPSLDLGAGIRAQLAAVGAEVVTVDRCTREDPDLYSFRRDGAQAGRLGGLVRLRP